jgi:hypothetical protein
MGHSAISKMVLGASSKPIKPVYPGFGLPLDETGGFRGFFDRYDSAITERERSMLKFMDLITDKDGWRKKVFDEGIVEKWRTEAERSMSYWSRKAFDEVNFQKTSHRIRC